MAWKAEVYRLMDQSGTRDGMTRKHLWQERKAIRDPLGIEPTASFTVALQQNLRALR